MRCTSANQPAKGPSFAVKPCIRFRLARKPTSAIGVVRNGFLPLGGASAIRCTLAARNRIGGKNFAARQPCNVRPAARAFWRNWPINTVHVGNRSRCGAFACGCGARRPGLGASATLHAGQPTSVRMRCGSHRLNVGNRSRWGAFACGLRFASARSRCGCGATATGLGAVRS
jgi:hypothetical protein